MWLKDEEGCYCGWEFQVHRYFGFAIATLQLSNIQKVLKFQFFPLRCPSRNSISSKVFTLQLFQNPENVKISIFRFFAIPAEILYLQKYLTNFQKVFFGWKMKEVAIVVENFQVHRYFGFAMPTWPLFLHPENEKFQFSLYTVHSRNAISSKVFNEFSKKFFLAERWRRLLLWLKILSSQIFWFCNSNVTTFQHPENEKFQFFLYTVPAEMLYLQKYLTNYQKIFVAERWGRLLLWLCEFQVQRYFAFAIATLQLSNIQKM